MQNEAFPATMLNSPSNLVDSLRFCTYTIMSSVNPYSYLELRYNTILSSQ